MARPEKWFLATLGFMSIMIGLIVSGSGLTATTVLAAHKSKCGGGNMTINCPPPPPPPPPPNCPKDNSTKCPHTPAKKHHGGSGSSSKHNSLTQLPSITTDFPGNDASVIQVHVTSAKKDIAGAWHVVGEITNQGPDTLSFVGVTVHFYDAINNLVGVSTCCDTTPTNIDPGHTATFDSFATPDQISGKPVSYRLSYDWNAPTATPSQSANNLTAGNLTSAGSQPAFGGKSSPSSSPIISSSSSNSRSGLQQVPSKATDYPGNDPSVIQVHVTSSKKDIAGTYHITGEITNIGNDTLSSLSVTAHLYDASGNLVGDALGYATPVNIDPGHTGTFDSLVLPEQLTGKPVSYRLSYDWS